MLIRGAPFSSIREKIIPGIKYAIQDSFSSNSTLNKLLFVQNYVIPYCDTNYAKKTFLIILEILTF